MKKIVLLTTLFQWIAGFSFSQLNFQSAFSLGNNAGDQGFSITADASGNYYATGEVTYWMNANPLGVPFYTTNNGGKDIYVARYNSAGIMQWAFDIGGTGDETPFKITSDAGGNIYITGRFENIVDFDPGSGNASRTSNGGFDIFLAKYDANGNFQWVNTFGGALNDQGMDVTVDPVHANVIITGGYQSLNMDMDPGGGTQIITNNGNASFNTGNCYVAAYSASVGVYQWAFNIGGYGGATGNKVATDNAGNIYAGGTVSGDSTDFDPGNGTSWIYNSASHSKVFLAKYNGSNSLLWVNGVGGNYGQTANSLAVDDAGSVYQGGYFNSDSMDIDPGSGTYYLHNYPGGVQDIYIAKFNAADGSLNWAFAAGGPYSEVAQDLVLDHAGHFFITGNFGDTVDFDPGPAAHNLTGVPGSEGYLAEYDTAGNYISAIPFSSNTGFQFGIGVCMIPPDKVGVTGFFSADSVDFDPGASIHNLYVNGGNTTFTDAFVAVYSYASTGIQEAQNDAAINVYNDYAGYIHINGEFTNANLVIHDTSGKMVFSQPGINPGYSVSSAKLSAGLYIVSVITNENVFSEKVPIVR
jgi:hypothetical protein